MAPRRNYSDPAYAKWRKAVFKRDQWKCKMPGCPGLDKKISAHHIMRWADNPLLRTEVTNGVTLCVACHHRISGTEEEYIDVFRQAIIASDSLSLRLLLLMKGS